MQFRVYRPAELFIWNKLQHNATLMNKHNDYPLISGSWLLWGIVYFLFYSAAETARGIILSKSQRYIYFQGDYLILHIYILWT